MKWLVEIQVLKVKKKLVNILINYYKSLGITFPKGASSYYQKVPAAFMTKKFGNKGV